MINTLSRIGMPTNATLENRKLSLDLAGLLLRWEKQRRDMAAAAAAGTGGAEGEGGDVPRAGERGLVGPHMSGNGESMSAT
jgi:transformation/transcription domain-associated protein